MHTKAFTVFLACMLGILLLHPCAASCATQPDAFEKDNSYLTAHVVDTSQAATPVEHNFAGLADEDWVKFYSYATAGKPYPYNVYITDPGPRCQVEVSVFKGDGQTLLTEPVTAAGKGQELTATFTCTEEGVYFVRLRNKNPFIFGKDTQYWLKVQLAITFIPKPIGTVAVSGMVTDTATGRPVSNALIKSSLGIAALPDEGFYYMLHPTGSFTLTATSDGYLPYTTGVTLSADTTLDIPLERNAGALPPGGTCLVEQLYGQESPEVHVLRHYRDDVLAATPPGRAAIRAYYAASPRLAALCRQQPELADFFKKLTGCAISLARP